MPPPLWIFHPSSRCLPVFPTGWVKPPPILNEKREPSCAPIEPTRNKPIQHAKVRLFIVSSLRLGLQLAGRPQSVAAESHKAMPAARAVRKMPTGADPAHRQKQDGPSRS